MRIFFSFRGKLFGPIGGRLTFFGEPQAKAATRTAAARKNQRDKRVQGKKCRKRAKRKGFSVMRARKMRTKGVRGTSEGPWTVFPHHTTSPVPGGSENIRKKPEKKVKLSPKPGRYQVGTDTEEVSRPKNRVKHPRVSSSAPKCRNCAFLQAKKNVANRRLEVRWPEGCVAHNSEVLEIVEKSRLAHLAQNLMQK